MLFRILIFLLFKILIFDVVDLNIDFMLLFRMLIFVIVENTDFVV